MPTAFVAISSRIVARIPSRSAPPVVGLTDAEPGLLVEARYFATRAPSAEYPSTYPAMILHRDAATATASRRRPAPTRAGAHGARSIGGRVGDKSEKNKNGHVILYLYSTYHDLSPADESLQILGREHFVSVKEGSACTAS